MLCFLSILDFRASLEDFVQLWQYLASQKCPFEAHSAHARPLHCHVIPPSYRGRRDKPWGKGTQTVPCFFKMESMKRRMLICSSGNDLIPGGSAGLRWSVCWGLSKPRDLQTQQKRWGLSVDRCWHCSVVLNRNLSQGVQAVCKAVKKPNFLVKQPPLFFQFTWQGLRQMLLNTLFHWERGWCSPPPASNTLLQSSFQSCCPCPFVLPSWWSVSTWHNFYLVFKWLECARIFRCCVRMM